VHLDGFIVRNYCMLLTRDVPKASFKWLNNSTPMYAADNTMLRESYRSACFRLSQVCNSEFLCNGLLLVSNTA